MNKTSNKTAKTAKSTKDTNSMKKSATTKDASVNTKNTKSDHKVISDYNGYNYKKVFWEDSGREYEDLADRTAIRRLLPKNMDNFVDICGGYGRLANEYLPRAKRATLFDYSKLNLEQAREEFGDNFILFKVISIRLHFPMVNFPPYSWCVPLITSKISNRSFVNLIAFSNQVVWPLSKSLISVRCQRCSVTGSSALLLIHSINSHRT